jgi:hypothetical protein
VDVHHHSIILEILQFCDPHLLNLIFFTRGLVASALSLVQWDGQWEFHLVPW